MDADQGMLALACWLCDGCGSGLGAFARRHDGTPLALVGYSCSTGEQYAHDPHVSSHLGRLCGAPTPPALPKAPPPVAGASVEPLARPAVTARTPAGPGAGATAREQRLEVELPQELPPPGSAMEATTADGSKLAFSLPATAKAGGRIVLTYS